MVSKFEWQVDDEGRLVKPFVHDGTIFELSLLSEFETLRFSVRPEMGGITPHEAGVFQLVFSGLYRINIVNLWNCPIISIIRIWRVNAVPEGRWNIPDGGWRLFFHNQVSSIEKAKEFAAKIIQEKPNAFFVEVSCSYSGPMAFICDDIEVFA